MTARKVAARLILALAEDTCRLIASALPKRDLGRTWCRTCGGPLR